MVSHSEFYLSDIVTLSHVYSCYKFISFVFSKHQRFTVLHLYQDYTILFSVSKYPFSKSSCFDFPVCVLIHLMLRRCLQMTKQSTWWLFTHSISLRNSSYFFSFSKTNYKIEYPITCLKYSIHENNYFHCNYTFTTSWILYLVNIFPHFMLILAKFRE